MGRRKTIVVHTRLAGHMARVEAARACQSGVQIKVMDQLAARLAGGFLEPIDADALDDAVSQALRSTFLGEFEKIKNLPGMVRAAISTLEKVWQADIDLTERTEPRLKALAALEREVLSLLPPAMKRPGELVRLALARIQHAKVIFGPIKVHGRSEMAPVWRPLLGALAEVVPVMWNAGPRPFPGWLSGTKIVVEQSKAHSPLVMLYSCAHPQHEVLEALRWARALLASGSAQPHDIAIAAASPGDFDDHVIALAGESHLPIHFTQGIKALTHREGQAAAALAEVLVKGISHERVRRLLSLLHGSPALKGLSRNWASVLPEDAPLITVERWKQAFAQIKSDDWPDGLDRSSPVLEIITLLAKGATVALEAGDKLLSGLAQALWKRALKEGPPQALPVTLTQLRIDDGGEAATSIVWTSARALASAPRPFAWLIGLNAGRWPRGISEDRLIADHIIPTEVLDPLPIADADRRDFRTIKATTAQSLTFSFSRRDVEGRLLGRSPLTADYAETYLGRGRIPEHAATETDRLLARRLEFVKLPIAVCARSCWQDWRRPELTAHDGLLSNNHSRISKVFGGPLSATSLKLLLRDPIRFVWQYALGWREPEESEEPLILDALGFGSFVHDILEMAVSTLESNGGFAKATAAQLKASIGSAIATLVKSWEIEQAVPPPVMWKHAQQLAADLALKALTHPLEPLPAQTSWTEVPFGAGSDPRADRHNLPWTANQKVEIPGTGLHIRGYIDRLDLAGNRSLARVIDYKTGKLWDRQAEIILDGGNELQRCLYAYAVKSLLGTKLKVTAALLFPRATDDQEALYPLENADEVAETLARFIALARANLENGFAVPGTDAASDYNNLAFALPANAAGSYLPRKGPLVAKRLGEAVKLWEHD